MARTGLQECELSELGIQWASAVIRSRAKAGYFSGAGEITVKVLAERGTGRLPGGRIVGVECSDEVFRRSSPGVTKEDHICVIIIRF